MFQVNEDDFSMFKNVIHIDAGDNNLELGKYYFVYIDSV